MRSFFNSGFDSEARVQPGKTADGQQNSPNPLWDPGRLILKIGCAYRIRRSRARRTGRQAMHTHMHNTTTPKLLKIGIGGSISVGAAPCQLGFV
jgi:hypothetical protein